MKINTISEPILFADDTSVIISKDNYDDFKQTSNLVLYRMCEWFDTNQLVLNVEKTNTVKFTTTNLPHYPLAVRYADKHIKETTTTKFLGIQIDNHLNWKSHIDHIIRRLSAACFAARRLFHILNIDALLCIHSFCNIIWNHFLGGNSTAADRAFILQKRIIRIMAGVGSRSSCRSLFKKLAILPVPCQYIFSLMMIVVDNQENFQTNSSIHGVDTRNKTQLHRPIVNLSCFQKGVSYVGVKIFNILPSSISNLRNDKLHFKVALKRYLMDHSFYSLAEFLMHRNDISYDYKL
jgi:hypothetical protein